MIQVQKIFPSIIILLMIGAAVVFFLKKDIKMTLYWASAALVNIAVTWL